MPVIPPANTEGPYVIAVNADPDNNLRAPQADADGNLLVNIAAGSCRSATPATASAWDRAQFPIPDGYEILGDGTLQIGMTAVATYTTNAPTWDVTIIGYEY